MVSDLSTLTTLIAQGGVLPLLLVVLWVGYRQYRRLERRCDRWERLALQTLVEADKSTALAEFFRDVASEHR